jgi:cell division protein FtsN
MRWTKALAPLLVTLVAGCAVQRVPTKDPAATAPANDGVYEPQREAASPPPPAVSPSPTHASPPPPNLEVPAPVDLDSPAVTAQDLAPSATTTAPDARIGASSGQPGFRVQVFAGGDSSAAEEYRSQVESRTGLRAYVSYQAPYYKVRVGDCPSNEACREIQERLRAAGYEALWIVSDQIAR